MVQAIARDAVEAAAPVSWLDTYQGDTTHALAAQLVDEVLYYQRTVDGLPTGHGNGIVIQNLVGDIDPGRNCGADCQDAGVKIGAIPQVLEDVFGVGKRRLSDPRGSLAAHLGKRMRFPIGHPGSHVVAANSAQCVAAFRYAGRGIVRAARTEMRCTFN